MEGGEREGGGERGNNGGRGEGRRDRVMEKRSEQERS